MIQDTHEPEKCSQSDTAPPSPYPPAGAVSTSPTISPTSPSPSPKTAQSPYAPSDTNSPQPTPLPVPINLIDTPDDRNGRLEIDNERIHALATDIAATGQLHPITLRRTGPRYELIAGRHRLAAHRLLRRTEITATVLNIDPIAAAAIRLQENVNRTNLSPVEEATQLAILVNQHPKGVDGLAQMLGRSVNWILDRLELKDWPDYLLAAVHAKTLSLAAARQLSKVTDDDHRRFLVQTAIDHGVTAATARYWLQQWKAGAEASVIISENQVEPNRQQYQTETTVQCFTCNERAQLTETIPIRVCNHCLRTIDQAKHAQAEQPQTQPYRNAPLQ